MTKLKKLFLFAVCLIPIAVAAGAIYYDKFIYGLSH